MNVLILKKIPTKVLVKNESGSRSVSDFVTPWTIACQASLSMEFSRQEYWSGLPFPSPRDLPDPVIELRSPALQVDSLPFEPRGKEYYACNLLSILKRGGEMGEKWQ